jgi:hypothetical protein
VISPVSPRAIPEEWGLTSALMEHPGLNVIPGGDHEVVIGGDLRLSATGPDETPIEDNYSIELRIPRSYPSRGIPRVFEKANRIPSDYHHLADGSLCLGAPTRLRLIALRTPTVGEFIRHAVIPYFYARSYWERYGRMPFGELAHGNLGIARDLVAMLHMPQETRVDELLQVMSMRRRHANKRRCPCGRAIRLGKCHNVIVNAARAQLGRPWFAAHLWQLFGTARSARRLTRSHNVGAVPQPDGRRM